MADTGISRALGSTSPSFIPVNTGTPSALGTLTPIVATAVTSIPTAPGVVATTGQPSAYTTLIYTETELGNSFSQTTFKTTTTIFDPSVYSSLTAAAASSSHATTNIISSTGNDAASSTSVSTSRKSSSPSNTIIPAVVVPVAVVLVASFALFWFFMRRRHRRDLKNQPAFIMAAKTEKLNSRATSLSSGSQGHGFAVETTAVAKTYPTFTQKPLPWTQTRSGSPNLSEKQPSSPPRYATEEIGLARAMTSQEEYRLEPISRPPRTADSRTPFAGYNDNYSTVSAQSHNSSRTPQTPHNSIVPRAAAQVSLKSSGRGPPPGVGTSPHVLARNRSRSLSNPQTPGPRSNTSNPNLNAAYRHISPVTERPPTAPSSGFRGPSPQQNLYAPGQQQRNFSPIGNRAPPPAPIKAPPPTGAFNGGSAISQYSPIIKDAPRAKRPSITVPQTRVAYFGNDGQRDQSSFADPGHSPLLPSPADDLTNHNLTAENLRIARLANASRLGFMSPDGEREAEADRISEISKVDEHEHEHEDFNSEVSSLNELERFDFERDTRGSGNGSTLSGWPGRRSQSPVHRSRSRENSPWR